MGTSHVEGKAVGVAETIGIDLIHTGFVYQRVVGRNAVGAAMIHIEAQNIAEQVLFNILAVAAGIGGVPICHVPRGHIIGSPTIANGNIQVPGGTKGDGAAIVVGLGVIEFQDN